MIDALQEELVLQNHTSAEPFDVNRASRAVNRLVDDSAIVRRRDGGSVKPLG